MAVFLSIIFSLGGITTLLIGLFTLFFVYDKFFSGPGYQERRRAYEVDITPVPGEGKPKRAIGFTDLVTKPHKDVSTLYELLIFAANKYKSNKCVGWRDLVKIHSEEKEITKIEGGEEKKEKKTWQFFQMSEYKWLNYGQFAEKAKLIGYGLSSPEIGMKRESFLGLYSASQFEWIAVAHGCWSQSITVVTAYANLGEEGLVHSLNQGEIAHLFTNHDLLPMVQKVQPLCKFLKIVIYTGTPKEDVLEGLKKQGLQLYSLEELEKIGSKVEEKKTQTPNPEDLAVIMYTSGTTDLPKGVMMTHANLIAAIAGPTFTVEIRPTDVYVAYLPLAHVLELCLEHFLLFSGVALGYANNRTLTDASVRQCKGDLRELKPTLMAGVPVVWERIRKAVISKVEHGPAALQFVFNTAYSYKAGAIKQGKKTPIVDAIVFKALKEQVGGNVRLLVSGGAPLSAQTHEFLRIAFSCPVLQGYGLTEICGLGCTLPVDHVASERVGAPFPSCEIKLVDAPALGYTSQDKPYPRGEIWFRGGLVTRGYFKNEEKTKEDFHDGWFATGDIGEWMEDGTLCIIDRKKNLIKLSHGEYIAVEKLESKYHSSPFVENIMVYADGLREYPVALVRPSEPTLTKWAKEKGILEDFASLCNRKDAKAVVLESLQKYGKNAGLKELEIVKQVYLAHEEWTPENGLLTAAMKLKRQDIIPKYRKEIDQLYA